MDLRPVILDLDGAVAGQTRLMARARAAGAVEAPARDLGPHIRLWSRPPGLEVLRRRLEQHLPAGPVVVFGGSGDFHHVAALLIERAAAAADEPICVVHFDNHPDWVRFGPGLHCGSWAARVAGLSGVGRVITVGVCSRDIGRARVRRADPSLRETEVLELYADAAPEGGDEVTFYGRRWPTMTALGEDAFAALLLERIGSAPVYVTIDKDVLDGDDAATNWDQGRMTLDRLADLVERVLAHGRAVGADVFGDWSKAVYGGSLPTRLLKMAEAALDQPRAPRSIVQAARTNETANLRLLALFGEARS